MNLSFAVACESFVFISGCWVISTFTEPSSGILLNKALYSSRVGSASPLTFSIVGVLFPGVVGSNLFAPL